MRATPFFLRTMGSPGLFDPAGEPVRFRVRKHLALLIYLAIEGSGVYRRDSLADLLWPSARTAHEGRHSLATGLSVLRAKLGPGTVMAARDTVQLTLDGLTVDTWYLQADQSTLPEQFPAFELDAFLEPFELQDAEPFMRWRERMQARLLPAITAKIDERIDSSRRRGDAREMERLADRLLTLDPLNEQGIRAKMEACAFAGDRVAALRVFEQWKRQLAQEFGAVPSELTERIAARLRVREWDRASEIRIPSASTEQWRDRVFLGREREYQLLYDAWESTRARQPRHALIYGEPGIGKTTLAERLTTAAQLKGAAVARVKCYEVDRTTPYAALSLLVTQLLRLPGASATWPAALGTLTRIAPDIRIRFPSAPEPQPSQGESARVHLAEAFHQLASAVADENPLIVVLDDIHLTDDATLAALHLAIRRTVDQTIMFVLTLRQGQPDQAPHITELCDAAGNMGFTQVELAPLPDAVAYDLVDRLLGESMHKITPAARRAIVEASGGHPMCIELLVEEWREHGENTLTLSVPAMTKELPVEADPSIRGYQQRVLDRLTLNLDDVTQRTLNVAALLGRRLNDLEFYGLVELTTGQTMLGLMRLKQLRVLRDGSEGLEFANEILRARAYRGVPSPVRKALHSHIADRLISAARDRKQDLEIAWHCLRAGRQDEAIAHLIDGAEQAARSGAPHEAERALATALPQLSGAQHQRATLLLAELQQEQGLWLESLATLDTHDHTFTSQGKAHAKILRAEAHLFTLPDADARTLETLASMHSLMNDHTNLATAIKAASVAAHICADNRDAHGARVSLALARTLLEPAIDPYQRLSITATCALLAYHAGAKDISSNLLVEAKRIIEANSIASSVAIRVYTGLGTLASARGDYSEALTHSEAAARLASRLGRSEARRIGLTNAALCHARLGNVSEQMQCVSEALKGLDDRPIAYNDVHGTAIKAAAHAALGENAEALNTLAVIDRRLSGDTQPWLLTAWNLMKADVLLMTGNLSAARECARQAVRLDTNQEMLAHFEGKIAFWTAELAGTTQELCVAEQCISALLERLDELDFIDQAEVLAASILTNSKAGHSVNDLPARLHDRLRRLPRACASLLIELRLNGDLRDSLPGLAVQENERNRRESTTR